MECGSNSHQPTLTFTGPGSRIHSRTDLSEIIDNFLHGINRNMDTQADDSQPSTLRGTNQLASTGSQDDNTDTRHYLHSQGKSTQPTQPGSREILRTEAHPFMATPDNSRNSPPASTTYHTHHRHTGQKRKRAAEEENKENEDPTQRRTAPQQPVHPRKRSRPKQKCFRKRALPLRTAIEVHEGELNACSPGQEARGKRVGGTYASRPTCRPKRRCLFGPNRQRNKKENME